MPGDSLKIAVVVPTLNQGAFLPETLDSFFSQTYTNKELIVVDGGSTDDTLELLKHHGQKVNWVSVPGLSQSAAINFGWQRLDADVISWLNSDDLLTPGALEKVSREFSSSPEGLIYGDSVYINADGQEASRYPTQVYDYAALLSRARNYIPQPSAFLRRSVYQAVGGVDERLSYVMDYEYWLRIGLSYPVRHVPAVLSKIRLHESGKSVAKYSQFAEEILAIYEAFFRQPNLPPQIASLESSSLRNAYLVSANMCYWAKQFPQARRYALQAWKHSLLRPSAYLPIYLAGSLGYPLVSGLLKNPYTARSS